MLNCHGSFVVVKKYKLNPVWICLNHDNRIVKYFSAMLQQKLPLKLNKRVSAQRKTFRPSCVS